MQATHRLSAKGGHSPRYVPDPAHCEASQRTHVLVVRDSESTSSSYSSPKAQLVQAASYVFEHGIGALPGPHDAMLLHALHVLPVKK